LEQQVNRFPEKRQPSCFSQHVAKFGEKNAYFHTGIKYGKKGVCPASTAARDKKVCNDPDISDASFFYNCA
jgi:hypothetical protein